MNRTHVLALLDGILTVLFVLIISTGLVQYFILPHGSGGATLWGMDRHVWGDIHTWLAFGMIGVVALHLAMHWKWIIAVALGKQRSRRRTTIVVGVAAGLLLLAAAPLVSPVDHTNEFREHRRQALYESGEQEPPRTGQGQGQGQGQGRWRQPVQDQ